MAVEEGDLSTVRQCLESGTNIECVRGKASFRVLHRAAEAGNKSMVRFLIQKKANVNAMAMQGWTPLDLACLLYTSPSPRDGLLSRMPSSA